ncbi:hypothetical protein PRIPAC_79732 [Pristionchus pacificus]|uniref:Nuclear receptor n=1 Tax=Pristionchus pacificus TaxID=54126 RepID=A0A2A6CPX6_PRIPA|nr:hypothetical protein PRIPAC_79732 [Pristionchus pacificus]|eukprot:PDM80170.1 nuclear receptor [Pristionchus pacificus]
MTRQRSCLICTAPSLYAHWGITSCRSCAEFFKRTIVAGRTFTCRQGEGNCTINPRDRHNCRGCRFRKCELVGMKFDPKNASLMPAQSEKIYLEGGLLKNADEEWKASSSGFIDHTTFFNYERSESTTPLLDKIMNGYSIMCLTRLSQEKKFVSESCKDIRVHNLVLYLATYSTMNPIYELVKEGIREFGNTSFTQFKALDKEVKNSFAERRLTCFDMLESTYRALHHFPDCRETRMNGYTTYFTNSDVEEVFKTCDDDVDQPKLMGEWKKVVTRLSRMVRYPLELVKPTKHEFAALLGLAFWNDENADESLTNTANKAKFEIIRELHVYYKEQSIADCATRIGRLYCLLVNCEECAVKVDEDFEIFRLMNMFEKSFHHQ